MACARRIVIGIGNPDRGDDAAGRAVARRLRGTVPASVEITEHDGEPAALLAAFDGAAAAFLIDACVSGTPAGTIYRFDLNETPLPQQASVVSSHGYGLAEAIELARVLGQLPRRCIAYLIEGRSFEFGADLSPPMARAVTAVVRRLRIELCLGARIRAAGPCKSRKNGRSIDSAQIGPGNL
jgi:hydrogenase maturation protease